jgi:hypothetical protein
LRADPAGWPDDVRAGRFEFRQEAKSPPSAAGRKRNFGLHARPQPSPRHARLSDLRLGARSIRPPRRISSQGGRTSGRVLETVDFGELSRAEVEPELETPQHYSAAGGNSLLLELETEPSSVTRPASGVRAQEEFTYSSRPAPTARKSQPIKLWDWPDRLARRFGYERVSKQITLNLRQPENHRLLPQVFLYFGR